MFCDAVLQWSEANPNFWKGLPFLFWENQSPGCQDDFGLSNTAPHKAYVPERQPNEFALVEVARLRCSLRAQSSR